MPPFGDRIDVYVGAGFTHGHDVLKAVTLGARAVLVGRAACWGLRVGAQAGVEGVLQILHRELSNAMGWCGVANIGNVDRELVGQPGVQPTRAS